MSKGSLLYDEMYKWASELFPICRSITGNGVRQTLNYMKDIIPELTIHEVPTGTKAFDWIVPDEWNIEDAYIIDPNGNKIVDFGKNNLHVLNYSVPVDITLSLEELKKHLYSIPDKPSAIPYVTSYYEKRWGFCISHEQLESLIPGKYRAVVKSTLKPGFLTYGEILLPGLVDQEIFFSTYVCHPSLANNEISGPVVTTALARWLSKLTNRRNTYRIVFGPETIGPIVYLSRHLEHLKKKVIAGFNVTCVGDNRAYSFLASRNGNTLADRTAKHVLRHMAPNFLSYSYLKRGSDERQYCAPGIDLPFVSIMRSKYGDYPEYHTSDDNLKVISPEGLGGAFRVLSRCVEVLELNDVLSATVLCEPQLGRRNLISNLGYGPNEIDTKRTILSHLLAYCDGNLDLVDIADMTETPLWEMSDILANLKNESLLASS